jgi:hypothetical protein
MIPSASEATRKGSRTPNRNSFRTVALVLTVSGYSLFAAAACAVSGTSLCDQPERASAPTCPRLVKTRGIGIVIGQRHATIGWMSEFTFEIQDPKDCRVVIVVNDRHDLAAVQQLLNASGKDISSICTM